MTNITNENNMDTKCSQNVPSPLTKLRSGIVTDSETKMALIQTSPELHKVAKLYEDNLRETFTLNFGKEMPNTQPLSPTEQHNILTMLCEMLKKAPELSGSTTIERSAIANIVLRQFVVFTSYHDAMDEIVNQINAEHEIQKEIEIQKEKEKLEMDKAQFERENGIKVAMFKENHDKLEKFVKNGYIFVYGPQGCFLEKDGHKLPIDPKTVDFGAIDIFREMRDASVQTDEQQIQTQETQTEVDESSVLLIKEHLAKNLPQEKIPLQQKIENALRLSGGNIAEAIRDLTGPNSDPDEVSILDSETNSQIHETPVIETQEANTNRDIFQDMSGKLFKYCSMAHQTLVQNYPLVQKNIEREVQKQIENFHNQKKDFQDQTDEAISNRQSQSTSGPGQESETVPGRQPPITRDDEQIAEVDTKTQMTSGAGPNDPPGDDSESDEESPKNKNSKGDKNHKEGWNPSGDKNPNNGGNPDGNPNPDGDPDGNPSHNADAEGGNPNDGNPGSSFNLGSNPSHYVHVHHKVLPSLVRSTQGATTGEKIAFKVLRLAENVNVVDDFLASTQHIPDLDNYTSPSTVISWVKTKARTLATQRENTSKRVDLAKVDIPSEWRFHSHTQLWLKQLKSNIEIPRWIIEHVTRHSEIAELSEVQKLLAVYFGLYCEQGSLTSESEQSLNKTIHHGPVEGFDEKKPFTLIQMRKWFKVLKFLQGTNRQCSLDIVAVGKGLARAVRHYEKLQNGRQSEELRKLTDRVKLLEGKDPEQENWGVSYDLIVQVYEDLEAQWTSTNPNPVKSTIDNKPAVNLTLLDPASPDYGSMVACMSVSEDKNRSSGGTAAFGCQQCSGCKAKQRCTTCRMWFVNGTCPRDPCPYEHSSWLKGKAPQCESIALKKKCNRIYCWSKHNSNKSQ